MLRLSREEKKAWSVCIPAVIILLCMILAALTNGNDVFGAPVAIDEDFTEETSETPEKGQIRANSAMPCEDGEAFRRWYEEHRREYEPETGEEARPEPVREDHENDRTEPDADGLPETAAAPVESTVPVIYRIDGETIDEGIQVRLYQHLSEAGIAYWYEGALAQMYQESRGQQYAVNQRNHEDMGLFQYKSRFWNWEDGDIFDTEAQIRRYVRETAARLNAGLSADEVISRHNTSDHVEAVNWEYVGQVKQWLDRMEVVR